MPFVITKNKGQFGWILYDTDQYILDKNDLCDMLCKINCVYPLFQFIKFQKRFHPITLYLLYFKRRHKHSNQILWYRQIGY